MPTPESKVPLLAALVAVLVAGACGGEIESAGDDESVRMIPSPEAPASAVPAAAPADAAAAGGTGGDVGGEGAPTKVAGAPAEDAGAPERPAEAPAERGGAPQATGTPSRPAPATTTTAPREPREPRTPAPVREPRPYEPSSPSPSSPGPSSPTAEPETRPETRPAPRPEPVAVPAGARLEATVVQELSTKTHRAGDRFEARLLDDVLGATGVVLLPRGARLVGRVLESRESDSSERPAVLTLAPDAVVVDGVSRPLTGRVVELDLETEARDSGTNTAAKVGTGAAAGAVLGKILGGDGKDALKGAAAGAAAGAAVAIATKGGHARVAEGARIVVVLDEPLVVAER